MTSLVGPSLTHGRSDTKAEFALHIVRSATGRILLYCEVRALSNLDERLFCR